MTSTGKAARSTGGNRYACKRNRQRSRRRKAFGSLPWSHQDGKGNAQHFRQVVVVTCGCANGCPAFRGGTHASSYRPRPRAQADWFSRGPVDL